MDGTRPAAQTPYLRHFVVARAVQAQLRVRSRSVGDQVQPYAFRHEGTPYQVFHAPWAVASDDDVLLGFAADLDWVRTELLAQVCKEADFADAPVVDLEAAPEPAIEERHAHVAFQTLFPFWRLAIGPSSSPAVQTDVTVFLVSTLLTVGVLILGVVLLLRDVVRGLRIGRLRSDFVSAVSHELKTPLTLIQLYGETLLDGESHSSAERRSYCEIILRESQRLTRLIEKVLEFSRVERGDRRYSFEQGSIRPVVDRTVRAYERYLSGQGFAVESILAQDVPLVRFDADAVAEAILILMENAAKYSGDSKSITVRLRALDETVVCEVEDTGVGIPRDEQHKIFQEFYRASGSPAKGGYGLGLFVLQNIMTAHGGSIEVSSEEGRGSLFRLIFPIADRPTTHRLASPREPDVGSCTAS